MRAARAAAPAVAQAEPRARLVRPTLAPGRATRMVPPTPARASCPASGCARCRPAASDAALQAAYARWKTDLITSDGAGGFQRVKRPNSGNPFNSSNSEGIGYGMIAAVYLDDQNLFDNLWKYEQLWIQSDGLMNWEINPQGTAASGTGAATDGDEDMAFALVMADKKWGGRGSLATTLPRRREETDRPHLEQRGRPQPGRRARRPAISSAARRSSTSRTWRPRTTGSSARSPATSPTGTGSSNRATACCKRR